MPAINTRSMCRSSFNQIQSLFIDFVPFFRYRVRCLRSTRIIILIHTERLTSSFFKSKVQCLRSTYECMNEILYMAHENFHALPCVFTVPYHGSVIIHNSELSPCDRYIMVLSYHLRSRVQFFRSIYHGSILTHTSGQKFSACDQFIVVLL